MLSVAGLGCKQCREQMDSGAIPELSCPGPEYRGARLRGTCWKHLSGNQQRERVADLVREIEAEAAAERERTGIEPPAPAAIRAQKPHDRPNKSKKSPAPFCHAASKAVRHELYEAYVWFVGCFRQAAEKWKAGDLTACFPCGSFPPGAPFVTA